MSCFPSMAPCPLKLALRKNQNVGMSSFPGGVGRDWSGLLPDVLAHIAASRLTSIDYLTFRTVCRSWASAVKDVPPAPHAPYLLLAGDDGEWSESFTFLSLSDGAFHRLPVPKLRGRYCIGSAHGWLATIDPSSDIYLLNPFTGEEIRLPSLTTLPEVYATYAPDGSVLRYYKSSSSCEPDDFFECAPEELRGIYVDRVVFSSDPAAPGGRLTVAAILSWPPRLMFTREGEGKWIVYDDEHYSDFAFHRGKLLGLERGGAAHAINLDGGSVEIEEIAGRPSFLRGYLDKHLVIDASGSIFGVWSDLDTNEEEGPLFPESAKIYIAKVDVEEHKWVPLKSLVGHSLFIGAGSSFMLSPKDVRGLKENCVYFTDTRWKIFCDDQKALRRSVGVYNLEDGTIEPCHAPDDRFNWPPPTWISPSLSKRAVS